VIFMTAHRHYAAHAFEIRAVDYLVKPFSEERFKSALAHARQRSIPRVSRVLKPDGASAHTEQRRAERLVIKSNSRVHLVRAREIDWCEAFGNYVRIHVGSQTHVMRETLTKLQARLDPRTFLRVHRSSIVNLDSIQELHPTTNGEFLILLRDKTRLTLSRGYRQGLQRALGDTL